MFNIKYVAKDCFRFLNGFSEAMCLSYPGLVTKGPGLKLVYSAVCRSYFKQQTKWQWYGSYALSD